MKQIFIALWFILLPTISKPAFSEGGSGKPMAEKDMTCMVTRWLNLTSRLDEKGPTGIPEIMALMHDDMVYTHTEFDANYDRAGLIDGFERSLKRADSRAGTFLITNIITGKNMVVTKRNIAWEEKTSEGWVHGKKDDLTTLFEFRDGKIWRITEYWD